jgi:hypothetical protein
VKSINNTTSQAAKKLIKLVPTSAAVKLLPKAVLTLSNTIHIDTDTTGATQGFHKNRQTTTNSDGLYHEPHLTPKGIERLCQRTAWITKDRKWNPYL